MIASVWRFRTTAMLWTLLLPTLLWAKVDDDITLSGQWFLAYEIDHYDEDNFNEFKLKRGYVTVKKTFSPSFSARITQDIAVDREGDGEGDIEIRLKYGYLRYTHRQLGWFTDPWVEFGLVHRPWLDFEQKINPYRVQGKMYLERFGVLRSADYGITAGAYLGGKLNDVRQGKTGRGYPGKYGSLAFGVYNGGGYEALETNSNKLLEGRLSLRPFLNSVPGFQFSWTGSYGKGNAATEPDFHFNALFLSHQTRHLTLTGLVFSGTGNVNGTLVDTSGISVGQSGWSLFMETSILSPRFRVFTRFDENDIASNSIDWDTRNYIAGISYEFIPGSRLVLDYDYEIQNVPNATADTIFELAIDVNY